MAFFAVEVDYDMFKFFEQFLENLLISLDNPIFSGIRFENARFLFLFFCKTQRTQNNNNLENEENFWEVRFLFFFLRFAFIHVKFIRLFLLAAI